MNTFNRCNCKPILKSELPPILQKPVVTSYTVMISEEQREILVAAIAVAGMEYSEGKLLIELLRDLPAQEAACEYVGVVHGLCL